MSAVTGAASGFSWPYTVPLPEVAAALRRLAIDVQPQSPLSDALSPEMSAVDPAEWPALLDPAIWVIARPERILLLLRHQHETTIVGSFLVAGSVIVGYDLDQDSLTTSAPAVLPTFAGQVARMLDAPDRGTGETEVMARRLLATIGRLLEAGLGDEPQAAVTSEQALAAVNAFLPPDLDPGQALKALQQDGILRSDRRGAVSFEPGWLARHDYLRDAPRTDLLSIELTDAVDGVWAPRIMSVVGGAPNQRIAVLTPIDEMLGLDGFVRLFPLDRVHVFTAVSAITGPPWAPARQPSPRSPETLGIEEFLREESAERSSRDAEWRTASAVDVLRTAEKRGPQKAAAEAMLGPSVTLQLIERRNDEQDLEQRTIAITDAAVVEWECRGSRIRWRHLSPDQVRHHVARFLPDDASSGSSASFELSRSAVRCLMKRRGHGPEGETIPVKLARLTADPYTRWCSIVAMRSGTTAVTGVFLLFAESKSAGTWWFEPHGSQMRVTATGSAELRQALLDGLAD